jgi:hypothetical protein
MQISRNAADITAALARPFAPREIRWRIQSAGERRDARSGGNTAIWCKVVPYLDTTAVLNRLTETVGLDGWQSSVAVVPGGVVCTVSLRLREGEWISRSDVSDLAEGEGEMGQTALRAASTLAFKRCCRLFGVGLELYQGGTRFGRVHEAGEYYGRLKDGRSFRWDPPAVHSSESSEHGRGELMSILSDPLFRPDERLRVTAWAEKAANSEIAHRIASARAELERRRSAEGHAA